MKLYKFNFNNIINKLQNYIIQIFERLFLLLESCTVDLIYKPIIYDSKKLIQW